MNVCKICGKEYRVRPSKAETSKTCSVHCKMVYLGTRSASKIHESWSAKSEEENRKDLIKVYEKFVEKKEGCWGWKGCKKSKMAYGCLTFRGKEKTAHRASYEIHKGKIPEGLFVLHRCDNASCTNPDHLFLGTVLDNKRDQIAKGRSSVEKLNVEKVKEIKSMLEKGILHKAISKKYGISTTTVWCIQTGKTWSDI